MRGFGGLNRESQALAGRAAICPSPMDFVQHPVVGTISLRCLPFMLEIKATQWGFAGRTDPAETRGGPTR